MISTFNRYSRLPIELQTLIWGYTMDAIPPRTVSVSKNIPIGVIISQTCPAVLHACSLSRKEALERYGSFIPRRDSPWTWEGSMKSKHLRRIIQSLRIIDLPTRIEDRSAKLAQYLNSSDSVAYSGCKYAKLLDHGTGQKLQPVWFDVEKDFAVVSRKASVGQYSKLHEPVLWNPWSSLENTRWKNLAYFVGDRNVVSFWGPTTPLLSRLLTFDVDDIWGGNGGGLQEVRRIAQLDLSRYEVIVFSIDETVLLEPGQWSFYLDSQSRIFEEEMGSCWANVTWNVQLAKNGHQNLCSLVNTWEPPAEWYIYRHEVALGDPNVADAWRDIHSSSAAKFVRRTEEAYYIPLQLLMESGGNKIYLGPL